MDICPHTEYSRAGNGWPGDCKVGCRSFQNNLSNMGNKSIIVQSFGKLQDERFSKNPENETRMSHSTGGQGCEQEGSHGCPKGGCVFLKIGRCKFADGHFFPTEDKQQCRQLHLCYTFPAGIQTADAQQRNHNPTWLLIYV